MEREVEAGIKEKMEAKKDGWMMGEWMMEG